MDSYIDEITKEQFIEDTTIRETINNIYDMLAEMPKEKRLAFCEPFFSSISLCMETVLPQEQLVLE